jgi:ADP-ribose pyrophosphatase YjhB (NUDIX family)
MMQKSRFVRLTVDVIVKLEEEVDSCPHIEDPTLGAVQAAGLTKGFVLPGGHFGIALATEKTARRRVADVGGEWPE